MKKLTIFLTILFCFVAVVDTGAKTRKRTRKRARTTRVVKKKKRVVPPTIHENPYLVCEDTCTHVHGIDMSHYQGEVFWETVGEKTKMAYVYLKATEGGDRIDAFFERNIGSLGDYPTRIPYGGIFRAFCGAANVELR